jgi:chromosome segregation ATPase
MAAKKRTDFQIGFDDEDPNAIYRGEMETLKIEKLSQRVTLLTILIPCLVGIMVFFGYLDIKDRLTQSNYTGTQGVEKLSRDMESRFSSLSLKQARLEEALATRIKSITGLEKSITAQEKGLAALDKQVKSFAWRDKQAIKKVTETMGTLAGKKELKALNNKVSRIDKAVAPLSLEISSAHVKLEALDTRASKELTKLTQKSRALNEALVQLKNETQAMAQIKTETAALETEMRALIAEKVDTVALANQVAETTEPLIDKVNDLLRRVGLLQAEVSALAKAPSPKPAPVKKATTSKAPAPKPTLKKAIPKTKPAPTKKIVEQELSE